MLHLRHLTRMHQNKNGFAKLLQQHLVFSGCRTYFKTQKYNKHSSPIALDEVTAPKFPCKLRETRIQLRHKYSTSSAEVVESQQERSDGNILKRVLNKVGFTPNTKTRLRVSSHLLYENVADKIYYLSFFKAFDLPNTFNSWFLVTELHVWMLLTRAMAEGAESGEDGRFLRNCIVEVMWGDVNTRAKKLGAHNPSKMRQQIEILSEQFQAALISYDEGIMSDDRILAGALWRRFFAMTCDDMLKIERLVKYVRQQMVILDQMPRDDFLQKPKIPWADLEKITL